MATKTVKNDQSSTGTKKKTTFATVQTAKQQLIKKNKSIFLHLNPAKSCVTKLQKQTNNQSTKFRKKTDSIREMSESFNRSYGWWSDTPQEWRNDDREESILDPKWNRLVWNTNELKRKRLRKHCNAQEKKFAEAGETETARTAKQGFNQVSKGNCNRTNKKRRTAGYFPSGN